MFQRPISGPGLVRNNSNSGTNVMAPTCNGSMYKREQSKPPEAKRVKLFNFWARKRIIQRVFVLFMLGWISAFIYQAGVIEILLKSAQHDPFLGPHVQLPEDGQTTATENDTLESQESNSKDVKIAAPIVEAELPLKEKEEKKNKNDTVFLSKFQDLTLLQGSSKNLSAIIHANSSQNNGKIFIFIYVIEFKLIKYLWHVNSYFIFISFEQNHQITSLLAPNKHLIKEHRGRL